MARKPRSDDEKERPQVKAASTPEISPLHLKPRYAAVRARYTTLAQRRETLERRGRPPARVPVEALAEQLRADPSAPLTFNAPAPELPLDAELAALRMAEQQAQHDLRAARDAAATAACERIAPYRRRLIQDTIAALTTGLEAIEADMRIRLKLNEAGYDDAMAGVPSDVDVETLRRLLERAREVGARG